MVDPDQIALQLRGDEPDFDRDLYDEDLKNFQVGEIQNDEDDQRILDSLPPTVKPKSLNSAKP